MSRNPVYVVGSWGEDGRFILRSYSNSQSEATKRLKEAIKDRSYYHPTQCKIYKVYPEEVVEDNEDLKFFNNAQKVIDKLDLQGNFVFEKAWKDGMTSIRRHISIYSNREFSLNEKTNTLIYKITNESYGDLRCREVWDDMLEEIYDALYCVEIPKMKKVLQELDTNIRISIVDRNRCKIIKGFITK